MIDFKNFTLDNQAVKNLNEVLFTTAFKMNPVFDTCTARPGVRSGKKLDYVDNLGDLANAGRGCDPTYKTVTIKGLEKEWALGDWSVPLKLCYETLENTIAEYSLRTGTDRENVIGTEFWNKIFIPLVDKAMTEAYWRMIWFSDKSADNVSAGGSITNGLDKTLFTMEDGLWKKIIAIATANTAQRTTIAANSQTTYATQKSALKTEGVALGIVDDLLTDADSRIVYDTEAKIMMTNSLYQALRKDYALKYKATIPFMEVAEGVKLPTYDGIKIQVVAEWDNLIKKCEDTGTALNNPHRALFASPRNLFVGTEDTTNFATFQTTFDDVTRNNYVYGASNIGTLVGEDNLLQVAF